MTDFPIVRLSDIPHLTTAQMVEVDRAMMEDFHIDLVRMMENAGRNLAHLARHRFLDGHPAGKMAVVLAGTGGNGGGALVCARRLRTWGADVRVAVTRPDAAFKAVPGHQLDIVHRLGLPVSVAAPPADEPPPDIIIDGLIGYSLSGPPAGSAADLIGWANGQSAPVLALDAPSGLDTTTGTTHAPAIRAAATLTLALPKRGLLGPQVAPFVGELYLADISVPPELYARPPLNLRVPLLFSASDIVRLV